MFTFSNIFSQIIHQCFRFLTQTQTSAFLLQCHHSWQNDPTTLDPARDVFQVKCHIMPEKGFSTYQVKPRWTMPSHSPAYLFLREIWPTLFTFPFSETQGPLSLHHLSLRGSEGLLGLTLLSPVPKKITNCSASFFLPPKITGAAHFHPLAVLYFYLWPSFRLPRCSWGVLHKLVIFGWV